MRPWQHASVSARRFGSPVSESLAVHELMDITKASVPDLRHRMVLHNSDLGPEIVARAFPAMLHTREIARLHARDDLGADVTLAWWLSHCDQERLPRPRPVDIESLVERGRKRARLRDADAPRAVGDLLMLPGLLAPSFERASAILGNSAGLAIVRAVLGPARELPGAHGRPVFFDPAHFAEAIIHSIFRRIPALGEVASALRPDYDLALREASHALAFPV